MRENGASRRERSLYEVLQVHPRAGHEVIQASYRALARLHHPDVSSDPGAAVRMREINVAYQVLSDPCRRADYDARRPRSERKFRARPQRVAVVPSPPVAAVRKPRPAAGSYPRLALVIITLVVMLMLMLWLIVELVNDQPIPVFLGQLGTGTLASIQ